MSYEDRDIQALILAGGKGKRMGIDLPKCMIELSGKRLIDMCIENLVSNGFRKFVFLLGYRHDMVREYIGDGRRYGIDVKFSIDPVTHLGWGKGKAVKYALVNNLIDRRKRSIITFPDDIILDDKVYSKFIDAHINAVKKYDTLASVILVSGTEYPYGVAELDENGRVTRFIEKPLIEKPTNIGIYLFEPEVYEIINKVIDLEDPNAVELESSIMPLLAKKKKLHSFMIDTSKWLPINTLKDYENALRIITIRR